MTEVVLFHHIQGLTDGVRSFADELQRNVFSWDSDKYEGETARKLRIAAMIAKIYPEARRALIAQGRPEADVEDMPVVQVAALYCHQEYRRLLDETYKWVNLPHWQSVSRADTSHLTAEQKPANPLLAKFWSVMPAIYSSRLAALRWSP